MEVEKYFGLSDRIAKWKNISEFESELASNAKISPVGKKLYAAYYRSMDEAYYEKGKKLALELLNRDKEVPKDQIFEEIYDDMVYCLHRYGLSFQDYIIYGLYFKSEKGRESFVSDKLRYYYCDILNAPDVEALMTDKYACYEVYSGFFKREVVPIMQEQDKGKFKDFIKKNREFIYKPLNDHSGHGIVKVKSDDIDVNEWFEKTVRNNPGIAEELIQQGEPLKGLNPASVNSCRVVTFTIETEVTIIGATLRIGVGNSIKDNAGSGGIYASVDPSTGVIQSDAKNYMNEHFLFHPTTHCQIIGFQMPEWDKAKALITDMATHRLGTTLISWDIAYSEKGWCMVEANDNGDWSLMQSNFQKGRKRELVDLMDRYFNSLKK